MSANHEKMHAKMDILNQNWGKKKWFSELRAWLGLAYHIAYYIA